jgi:hypothetical protein
MRCLESLNIALGDVNSPRGVPHLRGRPVEQIVALLHGEWPLNLSTPRAQKDFLYGFLRQEFGREFTRAADLGGFHAWLLRVDYVTDQTDAVKALLQGTLYQGVEWGTREIMAGPVRELPLPLQHIVACLVYPNSA